MQLLIEIRDYQVGVEYTPEDEHNEAIAMVVDIRHLGTGRPLTHAEAMALACEGLTADAVDYAHVVAMCIEAAAEAKAEAAIARAGV